MVLLKRKNLEFFKSLYQGIAGPVANLIARPGQAVQHAMGDTQPIEGKFLGLDITDPYADVSRGKSPISTVSSDIGRGVQTALLGVGGGTTSVASKLGLSGAKGLAVRATENAALGTGFQLGSNLEQNKNLTDNLGTAAVIGGALPILATGASGIKNAILSKATPTAETFINSLIKPLAKDFAYGKNPARGILNEGIIANSINDLGNQVEAKISSVGQRIGSVGEQLDKAGIILDLTPALKPIDEAINVAAKSNNSTLFQKLNDVKTSPPFSVISTSFLFSYFPITHSSPYEEV